LVPGTRSPGRRERRAGGDYLGLFKEGGREIGTRKQQRGGRERREKGEARELLVSVPVGVGGEGGRRRAARREMVPS
jgi:hypothetical protein